MSGQDFNFDQLNEIDGPAVEIGSVLDKRFEVIRLIWSADGSSYLVQRVCPPRQGELGLLKLQSNSPLDEDKQTSAIRFQQEIVAALSVKHTNVIRIEETIRSGDIFGHVTEYVEGRSLLEIIDFQQPIPSEKVVTYLRQLCSGLDAIHRAGIIHRGLHPRNILVTSTDHVKIINFALVKLQNQKPVTKVGTVIGAVDYLAPEYVIEGIVDQRLDIYALGMIGYEMICGEIPFVSPDVVEMFTKRSTLDPARPDSINSRCPAQLAEIIIKATHRDKNLRYQQAGEMKRDLERFASSSSSGKLTAVGASGSQSLSNLPVVDRRSTIRRKRGVIETAMTMLGVPKRKKKRR